MRLDRRRTTAFGTGARHAVRMRGIAILRDSLTGKYRAHGDLEAASCVIVCSFGHRISPDGKIIPGLANEYLANAVEMRFPDKPVIAQYEIGLAMSEFVSGRDADYVVGYPDDPRGKHEYVDTRSVLEKSASIMREKGWRTAVVVGHPYHLPRIDSVAEALNIYTVSPVGIDPVWDLESSQPWTRSPVRWRRREIVATLVYAVRGWLAVRQ